MAIRGITRLSRTLTPMYSVGVPMDREKIQKAASLLRQAWKSAEVLDSLPADCLPRDSLEGFAVQSEFVRLSGQAVTGWKIAATSVAGQKHLDVSGPLPGRLLAGRMVPPGSTMSLAGNRMRVAEPEFVFRMARDLPKRSRAYEVEEVLACVDALCPGLEIPDSRYVAYSGIGEGPLVADNACACWFILGEPAKAAWREIDLAGHRVALFRNGEPAGEGCGANVLGDPRVALTWLANDLARFGDSLRAGQIITTGTCAVPMPLEDGLEVTADFGILGRLGARFVE